MLESIPWVLVGIISLGVFSAHCLFALGFLIGRRGKSCLGNRGSQ